MMKKLLALALALMMLALPALAETATQTVTAPAGGYSIEVPAGWLNLNANIVKQMYADDDLRAMIGQNLGMADPSMLAQYVSVMEQSNMVMVYADDMIGNFNVQTAPMPLTMEQVVSVKGMMDMTMAQQYMSLGAAEESIRTMEIQQIGGRSWYGMQLELAGLDVLMLMTVVDNMQYVFTFGGIDLETCYAIVETFTLTE